jgi:hypothetical protein
VRTFATDDPELSIMVPGEPAPADLPAFGP